MFEAWISVNSVKPRNYAEFFVIQGANKCLLSKRTAEDLKILKVGLDVCNINITQEPFPKFPNIQVIYHRQKSICNYCTLSSCFGRRGYPVTIHL